MCTDFLVFKDKKFAHRASKPDNYVCYRTVICHALHWKMNHSTSEDAIQAFKAFATALNNSTEHEDSTFLSLYAAQMRNDTGYVIVDKSRGYYPLVVYPYTNKQGAPRTTALHYAVDGLAQNLSLIINQLENHQDWNMELQQSLQNDFFHYIEDENKDDEDDNKG